jgi:hypothetical protein
VDQTLLHSIWKLQAIGAKRDPLLAHPQSDALFLEIQLPKSPANKALQRTPLRVERDQSFFERWVRLDSFPIYGGGAAERQAVGRGPSAQ